MIKSVASVIPSYLMSYYSLPKSWCDDLDWATKIFWWGYKGESSWHLSLKAWKSICVPKCVDGLGIFMFLESFLYMVFLQQLGSGWRSPQIL